MHGAIVENRSVREVHEDSSTELMYRDVRYVDFAGAQKSVKPQSRKKCIFSGARYFCPLFLSVMHLT